MPVGHPCLTSSLPHRRRAALTAALPLPLSGRSKRKPDRRGHEPRHGRPFAKAPSRPAELDDFVSPKAPALTASAKQRCGSNSPWPRRRLTRPALLGARCYGTSFMHAPVEPDAARTASTADAPGDRAPEDQDTSTPRGTSDGCPGDTERAFRYADSKARPSRSCSSRRCPAGSCSSTHHRVQSPGKRSLPNGPRWSRAGRAWPKHVKCSSTQRGR